jgi:hypothetical protein
MGCPRWGDGCQLGNFFGAYAEDESVTRATSKISLTGVVSMLEGVTDFSGSVE